MLFGTTVGARDPGHELNGADPKLASHLGASMTYGTRA